jgi:hypothetical protein
MSPSWQRGALERARKREVPCVCIRGGPVPRVGRRTAYGGRKPGDMTDIQPGQSLENELLWESDGAPGGRRWRRRAEHSSHIWEQARSSFYQKVMAANAVARSTSEALLALIRTQTPFIKVWARLRVRDASGSTGPPAREHLLSPYRIGRRKIISMWGTDGTRVFTLEDGWVWIFARIAAGMSARPGRYAALQPTWR